MGEHGGSALSTRPLAHRNALVTGASRKIGIGAATALELARAGANVVISYHVPDEVAEVLESLHAEGVMAHALQGDLSQPEVPERLFEEAQELLGHIDILINNAAYSTNDGIDALTADTLDKHYAVNLRATALLCVAFNRHFRGESGRIINMTSGQSAGPMPGELAYVASKGAIEAFTVSLSAELASKGITVNAVDPGITDTGWISDELREVFLKNAPMGRVGTPQDAARLIRFLASDEAGWVTGQVLRSRGGL